MFSFNLLYFNPSNFLNFDFNKLKYNSIPLLYNKLLYYNILYKLMDYKNKYIKYKQKYLNLIENNNQFGGKFNKKYILIDGTGSSGKTSLCKYFKKLDYECIISDDYVNEMIQIKNNWLKTLSNKYITKKRKK